MFPKIQLAQLVISACEFYSIDKVVISPGSRNAPLTIGFSNHQKIKTFSVVDERCAAFFALGLAQQTQQPVALLCTSGSALLNYYPAIAEAYYSKIPLVVISADRPAHLIDIGDGQTIRQENVYQNHIGYSANLKAEASLEFNSELLFKAFCKATTNKTPVHINVPFDEPLYETVESLVPFEFQAIETKNKKRYAIAESLANIWKSSQRKLILVGVNFPSKDLQHILDRLIEDTSVIVMTETTSNLHHPNFINSIDQLISKLGHDEFVKLQPEVLITLGGFVVSKRIKQFLRTYQPKHHWHIDPFTKLDTFFSLTEFVPEQPEVFLEQLFVNQDYALSDGRFNYQSYWVEQKHAREQHHHDFLLDCPYADLKVFETVLSSIPDTSQLQISNSSIIRYTQLFKLNPSVKVFCNRGTSGIDGSTSTAIGASLAVKEQTVCITGDISFFYDSNALWNSYIPKDFRIILINNDGGGIFKIIPGPKSTNALSYFETKHGLTAKQLAQMFGFEYSCAASSLDLSHVLNEFYLKSDQPKILEIFTPSDRNDVVLQDYFNKL